MKTSANDKPYKCPKCGHEYDFLDSHYDDQCLSQQLAVAKGEIVNLKKAIEFWKDAWFEQRAATGRMAWETPNPFYLKNVDTHYFQLQYDRFLKFAKEILESEK